MPAGELCRLVQHAKWGWIAAPCKAAQYERVGGVRVEAEPAAWRMPSGSELLTDFFNGGESYTFAPSSALWRAAEELVQTGTFGWPLADGQHLGEAALDGAARAARCPHRNAPAQLPNLDEEALQQRLDSLQAAEDIHRAAVKARPDGEPLVGAQVAAPEGQPVDRAAFASTQPGRVPSRR